MSDASSVDAFLNQANEREKAYDWLSSVEIYRTALSKIPGQDILKTGEIHERLGYGFFRAACQADNMEEFKKRIEKSVESYEKAAELLENVAPARGQYSRGMARYSESCFVENPSKKMELLDDCWRLLKIALDGFDATRNHLSYGKAFKDLAWCLLDRFSFEGDWRERRRIVDEVIKYGQNAIAKLSRIGDQYELAWAYIWTAYLVTMGLELFEERTGELISMISNYLQEALELSEKIEDAYFLTFLYGVSLINYPNFVDDLQVATRYAEKMLPQSEKSNDHFAIGHAYWCLSIVNDIAAATEEDPDKRREKHRAVIRFAEESIRHHLLICRYRDVSPVYSGWLINAYFELAQLETSLGGKRALLKQAVEIGRKGSEYAQLAGSQQERLVLFVFSKAMFLLSETETSPSEKRKLLEEALELREKEIRLSNQLYPPYYWTIGASQNYLALIKAELAKIEENQEKKRHLLEEAVLCMEKCLEICTGRLRSARAYYSSPDIYEFLGRVHDWFGDVLDQLYSLTKDDKVITRAIEVYIGATQMYQKAGMPSRVAEAYWEAARLYNQRGEYINAADNFELASKNYQLVAEKIPQLKDFCQDQALYMQAWSEIEKGRHHHAKQEYGLAKEHYEKTADLHKPLKQWNYLAPNYSAWAELEQAEELSRREQTEEAVKSFEKAANLFTETEESLQTQLDKIEDLDEKQMVTGMLKTTGLRYEYCRARMSLEEAKILDKQGDHHSSSEKYSSAAETFEKITQALDSEQDKRELRFTSTLSRAWQKMTKAEEEASPTLYFEASQLFEKAKEYGPSERTKMLTLGHSRFCRALEAGTRFIDSRDVAMHEAVIQHLGSAADYYVKAGFQNASEYAKATKLLFDAYVHIGNAEREADPEKKAKLYMMAEKVLQTSAGSFMKAEHPEKREQVLTQLEKVKEERELALSLSEVLHAPSIVSTTAAFTTPTPTKENAVGLERFEHADVQANLIARQRELKVGENLGLEIELVNAGKGPALLTKITELIPEGFELAEKPEIYRIEDSYIDMKGKRLDPLKMVEVKIVLRPRVQGAFPIKPRVLYIDEDGKYKSHEPESITITVKELGIKGWIKGER